MLSVEIPPIPAERTRVVGSDDSPVYSSQSLYLQYLWNARHSARLCAEAEADTDGRRGYEVRGHALTAVTSAVAFLETTVNEVLEHAADPRSAGSDLSESTVETMRALWRGEEFDKASIFLKYQVALTAAGQSLMNPGENPYQDADLLVRLRNRLMHYKPKWQLVHGTPGDVKPSSMEKQLKNKFPPNQLTKRSRAAWYPDKCLGAGCAQWACDTAVAFVDAWWSRMGIERPWDAILHLWPVP